MKTEFWEQINAVHEEILNRVDRDKDGRTVGIYAETEEAAALRTLACLVVQVFGPFPFMTEFGDPENKLTPEEWRKRRTK